MEISVTIDNKGEMLLIVQWLNSIYGMMVASLIYYKKFLKTPKITVFQLNPYDPCVENRLVNDKHQTIFFHVE